MSDATAAKHPRVSRATKVGALAVAAGLLVAACSSSSESGNRSNEATGVAGAKPAPSSAATGSGASPGTGVTGGSTVTPAAASGGDGAKCPLPTAQSDTGVTVGLERTFPGTEVVTFGVPVRNDAIRDLNKLQVSSGGRDVGATVRPLIKRYDGDGREVGFVSVLVEVPASVLQGDCAQVEVRWDGGGQGQVKVADSPANFAQTSKESPKVVETAKRTIREEGGEPKLVETDVEQKTVYKGREPAVLARFPDGYLASTGILGPHVVASQLPADLAGLKFISEKATPFALSTMYEEAFKLTPSAVVGPEDLDEAKEIVGHEGWLYDRCATFLEFFTHTADLRFEREAMRTCSYYASKINLEGENRGMFTVTPEPDDKYSHGRGLYAYYALTGDASALEAGKAVGDLWMNDQFFVKDYREGKMRGPDKLWTERILGVSTEGMTYGYLFTGDKRYLDSARTMIDVAHRHITGDANALAEINPGSDVFPPQNCFIHNAEQASEGNPDQPWCSGWMPAVLMVAPLLTYQAITNDPKVDEIFIRLTRFLRDTGTAYHKGDVLKDDFLHPSIAFDPNQPDLQEQRKLVPLYGSGIDGKGGRANFGEYDDFHHCLDVSTLVAAGLRSLKRTNGFDRPGVGPFPTEGASFVGLLQELTYCANTDLIGDTRAGNDPSKWSGEQLREGLTNTDKFLEDNGIGDSTTSIYPKRKVSWWFNTAFMQAALLKDAGVTLPELRAGVVQP